MRTQQLPWSEIPVSRGGLGLSRIGSIQSPISPREATLLIRNAFELGINFFDTANVYGQGDSERILGSALRSQRSQIVIATKAGLLLSSKVRIASYFKPVLRPLFQRRRNPPATETSSPAATSSARGPQNFSSDHILQSIEASLRRLRTDYIDLFMLHSPPVSGLDLDALAAALQSAKRAGKIRAIGVSSRTLEDAPFWLNWPGVDAIQVSLNTRGAAPLSFLDVVSANRVSIIGREVLSKSSGSFDPEKQPGDALRSALRVANVVLFGTTNIRHLRENAASIASA